MTSVLQLNSVITDNQYLVKASLAIVHLIATIKQYQMEMLNFLQLAIEREIFSQQ